MKQDSWANRPQAMAYSPQSECRSWATIRLFLEEIFFAYACGQLASR